MAIKGLALITIYFTLSGLISISWAEDSAISFSSKKSAFLNWKTQRQKLDAERLNSSDQHKQQRKNYESHRDMIRERFKRVERGVDDRLNEHLEVIRKRELERTGIQNGFAQSQKAKYFEYEKHILPLKNEEYELEKAD